MVHKPVSPPVTVLYSCPTAAVTWRPWRPGRPITASDTAGFITGDTTFFTHTVWLEKTSRHAFTALNTARSSEEPLMHQMNLLTMCCSCRYWLPVQAGWPNPPTNTHIYWHWHNGPLAGRAQEDNDILTNKSYIIIINIIEIYKSYIIISLLAFLFVIIIFIIKKIAY